MTTIPEIDEWRWQFPRPHDERDLFFKGIVVGLDGSLLFDGLNAYVLARHGMRAEDGHGPIQKIDYFVSDHGKRHGTPMAQMCKDEEYVHATEMISNYRGFTVQRVMNFQRRWRARRPQIDEICIGRMEISKCGQSFGIRTPAAASSKKNTMTGSLHCAAKEVSKRTR